MPPQFSEMDSTDMEQDTEQDMEQGTGPLEPAEQDSGGCFYTFQTNNYVAVVIKLL